MNRPWAVRLQEDFPLVPAPLFTDVRIVKGAFGLRGAVYELTGYLVSSSPGNPLLTVYVRAEDTAGLMQWGYEPSGFFPQWIFPAQRSVIQDRFGVRTSGRYLAATHDPMTDQGDYYYSPAGSERSASRISGDRIAAALTVVRRRRTDVQRSGGGVGSDARVGLIAASVARGPTGDEMRLRAPSASR